MSKWINKDLFTKFQEEKKDEAKGNDNTGGLRRSDVVWKNPEKGTVDKAKIYEGRFVPDVNGNFYKKYYYHLFRSGGQWFSTLCPKTHDFSNYCPFCSVNSKLYMGTQADKKSAYTYKRKEKYAGNFYLVKDPRDNEADEEDKVEGKVKIYDFPGKVESKLKEEITDQENGLGLSIFDPGEEGYNFIIKVLATKPDKNKKVWPDYSASLFSRKPGPLGTEKEIDEIMANTFDIDEFINNMERSEDDIISVLKQEMVYDLVKDEMSKLKITPSKSKDEDEIPDFSDSPIDENLDDLEDKGAAEEDAPFDDGVSKDDGETSNEDITDADLLAELDSL